MKDNFIRETVADGNGKFNDTRVWWMIFVFYCNNVLEGIVFYFNEIKFVYGVVYHIKATYEK